MDTEEQDTREAARAMRAAGLSSAEVREALARLRASRQAERRTVSAA